MDSPFENLTSLQINKLYQLLEVHVYNYHKNEEILPTFKNENIIGIILNGSAQMTNIDYNGNEILIENLTKNSVFGTNISAVNNEECQITAKENVEVLVIDYNKIFNENNTQHPYFNIFITNLFYIVNSKLKDRNDRIRILEKKQIREKLLEYFEIEYKKNISRIIHLPFTLKDLADYIGVNRSAMFRELKYLKEDKFINIKGKKITLLYK